MGEEFHERNSASPLEESGLDSVETYFFERPVQQQLDDLDVKGFGPPRICDIDADGGLAWLYRFQISYAGLLDAWYGEKAVYNGLELVSGGRSRGY